MTAGQERHTEAAPDSTRPAAPLPGGPTEIEIIRDPLWDNIRLDHAALIASRCGSGAGTRPLIGKSHMR